MHKSLYFFFLLLSWGTLHAQGQILPLFPEGIPCANELEISSFDRDIKTGRIVSKVHEPEIEVFLPSGSQFTGTGVIVCPGGGYTILAWDLEGTRIAEWLNSIGVAAFVLKYRLPHWESEACRDKVALMDAQRAIRLVRSKAEAWNLEADRIGIMGFSAGGHLASTASTHFDYGDEKATNPIERYSCRPDFSILMYPVVSMSDTTGHRGSRNNLIGKNPDATAIQHFSNDLQVTSETPPALLIHADNDKGVLPENSVNYYLALRKHGIPAALHIYEDGGHGFGLAKGYGSVSGWPEAARAWFETRGYLTKRFKVLIIEGEEQLDPADATALFIQHSLASTGLFNSTMVQSKSRDFKPDFSKYDLIVLMDAQYSWPEETKVQFDAYLNRGGGLIVFQDANRAFPDWAQYGQMIGLRASTKPLNGQRLFYDSNDQIQTDTLLGQQTKVSDLHKLKIQIRTDAHPIIGHLPEGTFRIEDKIQTPLIGPAKNVKILLSAPSDLKNGGTGKEEPILFTVHYGLGRVCHIPLGYNLEALNHKALHSNVYKILLQRGAEWVASGNVTQSDF